MDATTFSEISVEPTAAEFLKRHNAEADFQLFCELVRECFPPMIRGEVRLVEDPDEENHTWVSLDIFLPAAHSEAVLKAQRERYYTELLRLPPRSYHPLSFSLSTELARE